MKMSNYKLLSVIAVLAFAGPLMADDAAVAPPAAPATVAPAPAPEPQQQSYRERLQAKYNLSPEQMKSLTDSNLPDSQLVKVAQLSKSSGKSIDEVLKMRNEQKMGWGKIAKILGVHPGELGRANSEMKKEGHEKHKDKHDDKREDKREEKREEKHEEKHEDKMRDHARKDNSHGKKDK